MIEWLHMKKSVIAIIAAAATAALSIPFLSGCSASVGYILKTDENGDGYYSVSVDGNKLAMGGELAIPSEYNGLPVKEIEESAFSNTGVTKITVPASITKIGSAAFAYNRDLKEVVFESGIALGSIAWGLFGNCPNLESVTIPDSVTTIDGLAFYGCSGLKEINFSRGLQHINVGAFGDCAALAEVEFPQNLISIGAMAFSNCTALKSVILPDSLHPVTSPVVDEDGNEVKDENGNVQTETTPAVGPIAFFGCTSLELAVLGGGITSVEAGTFGNCVSLKDIYLPRALTQIGGMYSSGNTYYGHAFYNVAGLTVHYAGTEEEWGAVNIDDSYYTYGDGRSDNSAIIDAEKIFSDVYKA